MNKAKLFKILRFVFGVVISTAALIYLILAFKNKVSIIDHQLVLECILSNKLSLVFVILLMPINWGMELLKWRLLTKKFQKLSLWEEVKSILAGICLGLITPNRVGEIGGRLLYIEKGNRTKSLYVNSVCSISQFLITLLFGFLAFYLMQEKFHPYLMLSKVLLGLLLILSAFTLILGYLRSNSLRLLFKFLGGRFSNGLHIDSFEILQSERLRLLGYSLIRYLIFSTQYSILLLLFFPSIEIYIAFCSVALIYLGVTIIPTTWLSSLPVKTSFAFFIVDLFGLDGIYGIIASVILWGVNLFLPSMIGLLLLSGSKFRKIK